ncbi:MAG: hypothetical protein U0N90_06260 [Blautia sp.]
MLMKYSDIMEKNCLYRENSGDYQDMHGKPWIIGGRLEVPEGI